MFLRHWRSSSQIKIRGTYQVIINKLYNIYGGTYTIPSSLSYNTKVLNNIRRYIRTNNSPIIIMQVS